MTVTRTTTPRSTQHHARPWGGAIAVLLLAGFVGPWLVWGSAIAQAHGLVGQRLPQGIALWTMTPSLIAALLIIGRWPAVTEVARRAIRGSHLARWSAVALATPIALAAATAGSTALFGGKTQIGVTLGAVPALVYLVYGTGLFLLTEEALWRGALLPRLQARLSPLAANLLLGGIWAVWHLPLLAVPGAGDEGLPVIGFVVLVVGTSMLIGTVVNSAGGSILVAAIFHAAFDASYSYFGVIGADHTALWIAAGLTAVTAATVAVRTRGRLGFAGHAGR